MRPGETFDAFRARFSSVLVQLRSTFKETFSDAFLSTILIRAQPAHLANAVETLELVTDLETESLQSIAAKLRNLHLTSAQDLDAIASSTIHALRPAAASAGAVPSFNTGFPRQGRSATRGEQCDYCFNLGHSRAVCRKLQEAMDAQASQERGGQGRGHGDRHRRQGRGRSPTPHFSIATATVVARALPPPMLAPFEARLELRLAGLVTALDLRLLPLVPQASRRHFGLFVSPLSLLRLPRTLLPLLCG